jgi:hypothetical protein
LTNRGRASLLLALACVSAPIVTGCGGGGTSETASVEAPVSASPLPPPSEPPPPPPPAPPPPAAPQSGDVRPVLYIEKDADGATFVRVQEQTYDPFNGGAQRIVADRKLGPSPGVNFVIEGTQTTRVTNVDAVQMKYGLTMQASAEVSIYDYTYNKFDGGGSIYGAAIKLGDNGRSTNGSTYVQRVSADGMQMPDATYKVSNNDFIGIEPDSGPIYVRDVSGKNFGDAGIDTKSGPIYVMNATLEKAHRMVRAWPGVEIVLVNSIINGTAGHAQGWVLGADSKIRYYNTLWCMDSTNPSPSDPKCKAAPWVVEGDDMTPEEAQSRFIPLQSNPLSGISPFFNTSIDELVVEYSTDGRTWQTLSLPNTGGPGSAPVGDTRYRLPLNLGDANYLFRASYRKMGGRVGATSEVIDEAGATQSLS